MGIKIFKNKRKAKVVGIGLAGLGVLGVVMILSFGPEEIIVRKEKGTVRLLRDADLEKEKWRASAEREIAEQKKINSRLEERIKKLESRQKGLEEKKTYLDELPPIPGVKDVFTPPEPPPPPPSGISTSGGKETGQETKKLSQIKIFSPSSASLTPTSGSRRVSESNRQGEQSVPKGSWIPSGSFARGVILSGLDAPTGVQASTSPHPVLIRLGNPAVLPNLRRLDVEECFVVGGGYGDLASERAHIRLERLSCVLKSENVIDIEVKGYVSGEDGKEGIRGRLVSKQGAVLAKAGLASFIDLVGDVFGSLARAVFRKGDEVLIDGGGVQNEGFQKLVDYYLRYADIIFPIIEIDSGRVVDVVILEGKELKTIETLGSNEENSSKTPETREQNLIINSGGTK